MAQFHSHQQHFQPPTIPRIVGIALWYAPQYYVQQSAVFSENLFIDGASSTARAIYLPYSYVTQNQFNFLTIADNEFHGYRTTVPLVFLQSQRWYGPVSMSFDNNMVWNNTASEGVYLNI